MGQDEAVLTLIRRKKGCLKLQQRAGYQLVHDVLKSVNLKQRYALTGKRFPVI